MHEPDPLIEIIFKAAKHKIVDGWERKIVDKWDDDDYWEYYGYYGPIKRVVISESQDV